MLIKLLQNEWMKLFNRFGTYVMCGLLILGVIITAIFTFYTQQEKSELPSEEQWHAELKQENETLAKRAKEVDNHYIDQHATSQQAINNYRLENNISPNELENVWSYMDTNIILVQLIGVFVIIVGASIVSREFNKGTIKLLLVRSASRTQILASKFIMTILFGLFLLVVLFGLSFIIGSILFGFDGSSAHLSYMDGEVVEWSRTLFLGVNYLAGSITLLMLTSFAFMISTIFRNDTIAIAISVALMFVGSYATNILALFFDWAKYSLFANTNLNLYFSGGPMVEGMTLQFSVIMLIVYLFLFLFLAFTFFSKRDVSI